MTESANVRLVRRALEVFQAGDRDTLRRLAQPDFTMDLTARVLNPDTYEGHEGIDRFERELREAWDRLEMEPVEFAERGDTVFVRLTSRLVGRGSGIELESEVGHVWTVRDGKLAGMKLFSDPDAARRFAGL